jgi:hypothetical protein
LGASGRQSLCFTFKQDLLDETGNFTGVFNADALLTLNGKDSFDGVTAAQLRDADGNLIFNLGCATLTGEHEGRVASGPVRDVHSAAITRSTPL